jgi:probable rRNA maturation factor
MSAGDSDRLRVLVVDKDGRGVAAPGLARWLINIAPVGARGIVSVALVSDACMRTLNARYRNRNGATDVLSFPARRPAPSTRHSAASTRHAPPRTRHQAPRTRHAAPGTQHFLGDIVIARGLARRQAREAGHSEATELRVLALHGLLHLLGYDHERDRGRMRRVERRLRRKGGLREGLIERGTTK